MRDRDPSTNKPAGSDSSRGPRRVAVLFSRLSGYMAACLRRLKERHDVQLLVVRYRPSADAPFEDSYFNWIDQLQDREDLGRDGLDRTVSEFGPDIVFMSGWLDRDYLYVARNMRRRGVPVVAGSDAQWSGSLRQQLGRLAAPWYLHRSIDVIWAAGERQRVFAGKLGYDGPACWTGVYACDWDSFAGDDEDIRPENDPHFLFAGRYVPAKGLDVLVEAYAKYRSGVDDPWPLMCVGTGEQGSLLHGRDGIEDLGFVQPDKLPGVMRRAAAFVLPSRKEAWGVVLQEAAASGLPLICSDACGAGVHLVRDGFNGFHVRTGDADHLAETLRQIASATESERTDMGRRSHTLSRQYTPDLWAETLVSGYRNFRSNR
ncbi:MAG: glycosyltransferase [Rhodothermales bacterium]|nr:glycosyltransferase [Rhodothermales bacterium]